MENFIIQKINLSDLAEKYGTPLYVYDADKIATQVRSLKTAFADCDVKIKYAMKACSSVAILQWIKKLGVGVDCVSLNEIKLAMLAGFEPDEILFTSSCVDFEEIKEAVSLRVNINIDSLPLLELFGKEYGNSYPCSIRLNPHIQAGGHHKISTGHGEAKFGISVFQLPQIMQLVQSHSIKITGLHIHTGSEITDTDVYIKMANLLFDIARDFPHLRFIDFGGGFKIAYKPDDMVTNVYDLGLRLSKSFYEFCREYGRKLELWLEPGKYVMAEAGSLLVQATVVKPTPSITFVGVNSGLNHLIRPMMYEAWHDIVNITNTSGTLKTYTVVGNICETDTFGADRRLKEVRRGDILMIKNAGAYGFSMSSQYNARFRPAEVLIESGEDKLIRQRETMDDLLRGQVY